MCAELLCSYKQKWPITLTGKLNGTGADIDQTKVKQKWGAH